MKLAQLLAAAAILGLPACTTNPLGADAKADRVSPAPATPQPEGTPTVFVRAWFFECTDNTDPDAQLLLDILNDESRAPGVPPDAVATVSALESLEARRKGRLIAHPAVATRCGDRAQMTLVSAAEAPPEGAGADGASLDDLRSGAARGFVLSVLPNLEPDGRLGLDIDFLHRPRTLEEDPAGHGTINQVHSRLTLPDGGIAVLGGQRQVREAESGTGNSISTLLLVLQATMIDPPDAPGAAPSTRAATIGGLWPTPAHPARSGTAPSPRAGAPAPR